MRASAVFFALAGGVLFAGTASATLPNYGTVQLPALQPQAGETIQVAGMQVFDNGNTTLRRIGTGGAGVLDEELHPTSNFTAASVSLPAGPFDISNNNFPSVVGDYYYVQRSVSGVVQGYQRCRYDTSCDPTIDNNWQTLATPGSGLVLLAQHSSNLHLTGVAVYNVLLGSSLSYRVILPDGSSFEFGQATVTDPSQIPFVITAGYVNGFLTALAPSASGPVAYVFSALDAAHVQSFTLDSNATLAPADMNAGGRAVFIGPVSTVDQLEDTSYCDLQVSSSGGVPSGVTCNRTALGRLPVVGALMNAERMTDSNTFIYFRNYQLGGGTYVLDTDNPAGGPVTLTSLIVQGPVPPAGDQIATVSSNGQILFAVNNGTSSEQYYVLTPGAHVGPLQVSVDIKPGSCDNPLVINSNGVLPVAIAGTADFDVRNVIPGSVKLAGALAPARWNYGDVVTPGICASTSADGYSDLILFYDSRVIGDLGAGIPDGTTLDIPIFGVLNDGTTIQGHDHVLIVNKTK